jgi:hypothetical protein
MDLSENSPCRLPVFDHAAEIRHVDLAGDWTQVGRLLAEQGVDHHLRTPVRSSGGYNNPSVENLKAGKKR